MLRCIETPTGSSVLSKLGDKICDLIPNLDKTVGFWPMSTAHGSTKNPSKGQGTIDEKTFINFWPLNIFHAGGGDRIASL